MSLIDIKKFPHLKPKTTKEPLGDIIPLSYWQEVEDIDFVCICCMNRWREPIALWQMERPQWMGEIVCPDPECGAEGASVRG